MKFGESGGSKPGSIYPTEQESVNKTISSEAYNDSNIISEMAAFFKRLSAYHS